MTNQELFDKVALHLRTQDGFAQAPCCPRTCLYRAPDGKKCAAGILILDEHYHDGLEGGNVDAQRVQDALIKSGVSTNQIPLVRQLQAYAHDGPAFGGGTVEDGLSYVAQTYDLIYTPPQGDVA